MQILAIILIHDKMITKIINDKKENLFMAKKTPEHGLRVTPGNFQIKGIITGTKGKNFYVEKDAGSKMRAVNFGVKYDVFRDNGKADLSLGKVIYPTIQGFTRKDVHFSTRKEDGTTDTKPVAWAQRLDFAKENPDWRIIGCNIGLEKDAEDNNIKQYLAEYDAAKYVKEKMQDDVSVFVRGNLDFRSYTNKNNEVKRIQNFNATQVSLCSEVDFEDEEFVATNDFEQEIIYTDIAKEEDGDGKPTGRFIISGYVVSFNAIEPVSFIIEDSKLANLIRKNLKAYNSIKVHGKIVVSHSVEEAAEETTDDWGDSNPMSNKRVNAPTKRELIITGATPSSITTDFSEEAVAEGIKILKKKADNSKKFGEKNEVAVAATNDDDWGTPANDNDEEDPW